MDSFFFQSFKINRIWKCDCFGFVLIRKEMYPFLYVAISGLDISTRTRDNSNRVRWSIVFGQTGPRARVSLCVALVARSFPSVVSFKNKRNQPENKRVKVKEKQNKIIIKKKKHTRSSITETSKLFLSWRLFFLVVVVL